MRARPVVPPPPRSTPRVKLGSLRDFLYIVFSHATAGMTTFAVVAALLVGLVLLLPPKFTSKAQLLMKVGRESVADPIATSSGQPLRAQESRQSQINSELAILNSQDLLDEVVHAVGAATILGPEQVKKLNGSSLGKALEQLQANLRTVAVHESNIVTLAYTNRVASSARRVLDKLIEVYRERHIALHRTPGSYEFFNEQVKGTKATLERLNDRLDAIQRELGVHSVPAQQAALLARLDTQRRVAETVTASIASAQAKIGALEKSLRTVAATLVLEESSGNPNAVADGVKSSLFTLQLQRKELLTKYPAESRLIRDIDAQILLAQKFLKGEGVDRSTVKRGINANHQRLQLDLLVARAALAADKAKLKAVEQQVAAARKALGVFDARKRELASLKREIAIHEGNLARYVTGLEQARIDSALDEKRISNISIVQQATAPAEPSGPPLSWRIVAAVIAALFAGFGALFAAEFFDDSMRTPDQVEERLLVPVLGTLPEDHHLRLGLRRRRWWRRRWTGKLGHELHSQLSTLAERVVASCPKRKKGPQILAVTAARQGTGTSTVALHLAMSLARTGQGDVLLIDANYDDPTLSLAFAPSNLRRLGSDASAYPVLATSMENLRVLPAALTGREGTHQTNDLRRAMYENASLARFVVIDGKPATEWGGTFGTAIRCDGVVVVVDAKNTRWQAARRTADVLRGADATLLGAVLNRRRYPIPALLYRAL